MCAMFKWQLDLMETVDEFMEACEWADEMFA
jgi:hypothetical protein